MRRVGREETNLWDKEEDKETKDDDGSCPDEGLRGEKEESEVIPAGGLRSNARSWPGGSPATRC